MIDISKCKHEGNRSGYIETLQIGIQGLSGIKQRRVERCMDCYAILKEPVTREEWKAELEPIIREQIAREDEKVGDSYVCPRLPHPAGMSGCDYCSGVQDGLYLAAIMARGEPNQVTKDAIEEARKMNGA